MIIGCLDHWGYQIITIHEVPSKQGSDCASRGGCITEDRASCGFGVPKSFGISEIIQLTILRPLNSKTYDARFAHLGSKLDSFQITQVPLWTGRGIYLYPNDRKLHTISPKQFAQPYNGG